MHRLRVLLVPALVYACGLLAFALVAGVDHLGADRPQMEWIRPFIYRNTQ